MRAIDQWVCDGCGNAYDGRPDQVVDVYDGVETYCGDCSEEAA